MRPLRLHDLSSAQQRLVKTMQEIAFGRIESLSVLRGEPVFDQDTKVIRERKFGTDGEALPQPCLTDFGLKRQVCELLQELMAIQNGRVACLEVRHGLPFRLITAEAPAAA